MEAFIFDLDAIDIDTIGEPERKGKERIVAELLQRIRLRPGRVAVVGDNPDSELAAGRRLGLRTVQILRPDVVPTAEVDLSVHDLEAPQREIGRGKRA